MISLASERLTLRDFVDDDVDDLFALYKRPETSRFESWEPHISLDESRDLLRYWVERQSDEPRSDFTFAMELQGYVIGLAGLELGFGTETDDPRSAFADYRLIPEYWNQGYATEAVAILLAFGFGELGLHRIHSGCAASNAASIRVLEKSGFQHEGTTRESFPIGDSWDDYVIYGLLGSAWHHMT